MWIHGPIHFECAPHPLEEFFLSLFLRWLGCVMDADETNPFFHQRIQFLEPLILEGGMSGSAIGINHNGCSPVKCPRILRPTIAVHDGRNPRKFIQARFQQQATRPMLVLPGPMAWRAGDEDNLFWLARLRETANTENRG